MLNKRGSSFADLIVGLLLLSTTLLLLFQFLSFMKMQRDIHQESIVVLQVINNESERAYRDTSWQTLTGNTFETPKGTATSTFSDYRITEYHTEHLTLEVSLNETTQSISIERSEHWNE